MFGFDIKKSLEELDGEQWGEPSVDSSLVLRCHSLRKKPLKDFSVGDLRIMIGQQLSLDFLVPLAVDQLLLNPYAEGDYYPGDLLASVLKIDRSWWGSCAPFLREQLNTVIEGVEDDMRMLGELIANYRPQGK